MRSKKILTSALLGGLIIGGSVAGTALPASARTITSECSSQLYVTQTSDTQGLWCQVQNGPSYWGGYRGDVDGVMGPNSWMGLQTFLRQYGYTGPIDGVPGTNTYMAMQTLARNYGYEGDIDGEMGPNSWRGFAQGIRIMFYTD